MCVKPIIIRNKFNKLTGKNIYTTPVPCGRCPECVKSKINSWTFRLDKQLEISKNPLFVTLTYDEKNIIYTNQGEKTLYKRDVQLFIKKLRKAHEKKYPDSEKLKYYACGEYGTKTKRPHYHLILFNCLDADMVFDTWGQGHTMSLPLLNGGTTYVLKYMSKQRARRDKNSELQPEFSLVSKGMGANYLTPQMISYHKNNVKNSLITKPNGVKMSIPKYYKDKIYTEEERKEVTNYLQMRSEDSEKERLNVLKSRYPKKSENFYQNLLEQQKNLLTFEKRKNDVL